MLLHTDYQSFLRRFYRDDAGLAELSYDEQLKRRNDSLFSLSDFYSNGFRAHGVEAIDVYANNADLQNAWAREHGLTAQAAAAEVPEDSRLVATLKRTLRPYRSLLAPFGRRLGLLAKPDSSAEDILLAQVEAFDPDVVLNFDSFFMGADLMRRMQRKGRKFVFYCGIDPLADMDISVYDLGTSNMAWVAESFRRRGIAGEQWKLAFEPTVLDRLGPAPKQDVAVSFVGSLMSDHGSRISLLEAIARRFPLKVWAPSLSGVDANSPLRACYQGEVYGRDFYNALRRSRISLNTHSNASRGEAANTRLFEVTGVGGFLLTDNRIGLDELFGPDGVATYASTGEVLEKIDHYLSREDERSRLAKAAQATTLQKHNYFERTGEMLGFIAKL